MIQYTDFLINWIRLQHSSVVWYSLLCFLHSNAQTNLVPFRKLQLPVKQNEGSSAFFFSTSFTNIEAELCWKLDTTDSYRPSFKSTDQPTRPQCLIRKTAAPSKKKKKMKEAVLFFHNHSPILMLSYPIQHSKSTLQIFDNTRSRPSESLTAL